VIRSLVACLDRSRIAGTLLVSAMLVALFLVLSHLPLGYTDVWAHLKFGQWMNAHGQLPVREPFCSYSEDIPYVPMAWLSQVVFARTYDIGAVLGSAAGRIEYVSPGGIDALRVLHAGLVTLRVFFLFLAYRRLSGSKTLATLGAFVALTFDLLHLDVLRPQVFGELCLAVMLWATCKPMPSRAASWCVPLLLAMWANLHGSFLNGLLVLLGVMASRFFQEVRDQHGVSPRKLFHSPPMRRFFRMFYLSVLAVGFLNPFMSFRWYTAAWAMGSDPNVATMDEWQRLDWTSLDGGLFAGSLALLLVTQLLARTRRVRGISFGHLLLVLCFGLQVVFFQRMMPWWAMLSPYVCMGPWSRTLGIPGEQIACTAATRVMNLTVAAVALWLGVVWSPIGMVVRGRVTPLEQSVHPATPRLLVQACYRGHNAPPILIDALHRPQGSVFCSETLGDYVLFATNLKVVVYTHVHLLSPAHWQRCLSVKRGEPQADRVLQDWNVQVVCVEAELHPRLCRYLTRAAGWTVVLDETGSAKKPDPKSRLFVAVRK